MADDSCLAVNVGESNSRHRSAAYWQMRQEASSFVISSTEIANWLSSELWHIQLCLFSYNLLRYTQVVG